MIYTKKQDTPDWIILNDMYFNVYTCNEEIIMRVKDHHPLRQIPVYGSDAEPEL